MKKKEYYKEAEMDKEIAEKIKQYTANCMNCGQKYLVEYDAFNNPISMRCFKCRAKAEMIQKQFKEKVRAEGKTDPMLTLAKMKIILDKCCIKEGPAKYINGRKVIPSVAFSDKYEDRDPILFKLKKQMDKIKIPKKYLIAESL